MKVSIVVPAYNEEKLLGETLAQVKSASIALARIGWETEWIVCDNNSTDRTAEIARSAGAKVVFEPVNQIARARNAGAAAASGQWLVFLDADSRPGPELFADMAKEIQSGKCIAGGATIAWDQKHYLTHEMMMPVLNAGFRWRRLLHGSFMFVEAVLFRKLGGFSVETFSGEDWELSYRLKKVAKETGKRVVVLPRPILTSARRMTDYSSLTPFAALYHVLFPPRRIRVSRERAWRWYDGRR